MLCYRRILSPRRPDFASVAGVFPAPGAVKSRVAAGAKPAGFYDLVMARADLIVKLFRSGADSDMPGFRKAAEAMIAEERAKKHNILADRLERSLVPNGNHRRPMPGQPPSMNRSVEDLVFEVTPSRRFDDLLLAPSTLDTCKALVEEQHRAELLRSHGVEPRHRVLLTGVPGNGKTTLAEALAYDLAYPLIVIRYEKLIGSFLGETSSRLQRVFEYIRTMRCVLFFDEFDAVGKERGDTHETGEIKRVVSSLLLQMDRLPSYVVVVAASNHPELLDKAVWRRFQLRLNLPAPGKQDIMGYLQKFSRQSDMNFGMSFRTIADNIAGGSFAEVEEFCVSAKRAAILRGHPDQAKPILKQLLHEWKRRSRVSGSAANIAREAK